MSATANNAGAGWSPSERRASPPTAPFVAQDAQDALQVLLAFACIHEQAVRRRNAETGAGGQAQAYEYFGLDDVLRLVAARALSITGADGVAIALAEGNAIVCRATMGRIAPDIGIRLDPSSGFSGVCLRSGETVRCDDSESDPRVNAQACRGLGTRSMVAVPLTVKGRVIGLIEAFSSETFGFNEPDVKTLNLLGELILAAIHPQEENRLAELAEQILPQPPKPELLKAQATEKPEPATVQAKAPVTEPAPAFVAEKILQQDPELPAKIAAQKNTDTTGDRLEAQAHVPAFAKGHNEGVAADPAAAAVARTPAAEIPALEIPLPQVSLPPDRRPLTRGLFVAALVVVAVGLGWAWLRRAERLTIASTRSTAVMKAPAAAANEPILPPPSPVEPGSPPEVTGIRHWSSTDSSTVVVDVQDQIQYEAHTLDNPPRIYFDLFDTKITQGLVNQSITVDDAFIKRVRVAQPSHGITRVVLDTKGVTEVSVKLDPNPYRLTIDVHKPPVSLNAPTAATLPKPSPSITPAATAPKKGARSAASSASEFRVALDAGHGGWDLGTVGRRGLLEKDLVLDVVERLGTLISEKLGADVIYTRQDDSYLPLEKRAEIANLAKADLFLSVHANYSDLATARGVETYYTTTYSSLRARTAEDDPTLKDVNWTGVDIREKVTDSHRLATDVQDALYSVLAARNPAIRNRGVKEAQYVVLTGTQMPAVLAEISFVSSPEDEDKLENAAYRQQIAEALYKGMARYRDETKRMRLASAKRQ